MTDHNLVVVQSNTFWSMTLDAHINTCMNILCRVYDQNNKSLHLRSWLHTIEENIHLFEEEEFRKRLKGNAFVDSLAETSRKPDKAKLEKDIQLCSMDDPLVKTLNIHRGSRIAHKNAKNIVAERYIGDDFPLTYTDIDTLLDRAKNILNRYSKLFTASINSMQIIGDDDYRFIIQCVEEKVLERRAVRRVKNVQT